jgi:hypothetical protein
MSDNNIEGLFIEKKDINQDILEEIKQSIGVSSYEINDENIDLFKRLLYPEQKSNNILEELEELEQLRGIDASFGGQWFPDTRFIVKESGLAKAFDENLSIIMDTQDLEVIISDAIESLLHRLNDYGYILSGQYDELSAGLVSDMETEQIMSLKRIKIPNVDHDTTWDKIYSLREHKANLSVELIEQKKSLNSEANYSEEDNLPVEPELVAGIVGMEVEMMVVNTIEARKTQQFYEKEVGVEYQLGVEPQTVLLILETGYILLHSSKILSEHRPDKYVRKKGERIINEVRERISSEEAQELASHDELVDTVQTIIDEWNSD